MSKLRIEKLKQGSASNNDVLVFRNDLGTFQGQSNLSLTKITLGTNTVNSSVYTGSANYLNGQPASFYAAVSGLDTAYANAVLFANTIANTAYTNAISVASTDATNKAGNAYSNAVTYADTKASDAYANAIAYSGNAAAAYINAVSYAASNSYVNTTFAPKANPTLTGTVTVNGDATITGNLFVTGTTTTVNTASIEVASSLVHLAANNTSDILDIGFVGHYANGVNNNHIGFLRSATDKKFYLFQNYQPEIESNTAINFANTSTGIQMADLVVGNLIANSTLVVTGNATIGTSLTAASINTTGTVTANVLSVSNVQQTQTNLQVDPAGSAFLNAIIYG